jgi:molybdenum cofactor cytidylyltransferase
MGTAKLALPLGPRTVLEHVLAALGQSRVHQTVVVVGPSTVFLVRLVAPPARVLEMPGDTPDMRATVLAGVRWLDEQFRPVPFDALVLALGDQPTLDSRTVDELVRAHEKDPTRIRIPMFGGKRGHPLLLPWAIAMEIAELGPDDGINALVRRRTGQVVEHACDSAAILADLDDPGDYAGHQELRW